MQNNMRPTPFIDLLLDCMKSYHENRMILDVPFVEQNKISPIGPAAGPHTQLAGNIVAAYAAGASFFELKTVQKLYGEQLQIPKPCIYTGFEAYNVEWSSEFSTYEAMNEYIKAYILVRMLAKEEAGRLGRKEIPISFIMSVGYDLAGIQSKSVDDFLEGMRHASQTDEWKQDLLCIKEHMELFPNVKIEEVEQLSDTISDEVTLSTMHGCPVEEIEKIATYLLVDKKFTTNIKLNPTLLGKEKILSIFEKLQYTNCEIDDDSFVHDITFEAAVGMIQRMQQRAQKVGKQFGVKLTNTFPVKKLHDELPGDMMYMSGPLLFPCAIGVASTLASALSGKLKISFSGGADAYNIEEILETGIYPVTVSTLLLKQGGYKNISFMNKKILREYQVNEQIDLQKLENLVKKTEEDSHYLKKDIRRFEKQEEYSTTCSKCNNCVDVCPNRANRKINKEGQVIVLHDTTLCNECGNCSYFCIMGHEPYLEKAKK